MFNSLSGSQPYPRSSDISSPIHHRASASSEVKPSISSHSSVSNPSIFSTDFRYGSTSSLNSTTTPTISTMLPPPATTSTASYAYQPANVGANPGSTSQTPTANNTSRASGSTGATGATNPSASNTPISGTGASSNPPPTNAQLTSKFNAHDIQVLRQLLVAGEKHKWKQITKEINQTSNNNAAAAATAAATNSQQSGYGYRNANSGGTGGATGPGANAGARAGGQSAPKNVSPTFVMKQYQSLLGLPNNSIYFGTLGSSLPYVVAPNGWDDIGEQHYQHHFGDDLE